jgi:peptidoglycan hydrolase-like protein with peptidoglycan-binding domain
MLNFNNDIKNPITEIQIYLREIAKCKQDIPTIYPNGIFDEKTKEAIIAFQKVHGIPTSGIVDLSTWDALVNEYRICIAKYKNPNQVSIFPHNEHTVKPGDENDTVYVIQILLRNIGKKYKSNKINVTGRYDSETEEAIKQFQKTNKLDITGIVDIETWNSLTHISNTCQFYNIP